ncbi:MAG TPA: PAS domain-containing protein, partial [Spirochaetia bacterium]|nr:PAS domain-containing protein [Spirochaetia bacterium]
MAIGTTALLVAVNNFLQSEIFAHMTFSQSLSDPSVYTLLVSAAFPFLTAIRDGGLAKWTQVLMVLGVGIVATVVNSPGDLTGIFLVTFALVLSIQYDLLGAVFWPQIAAAVILYGVFAVVTTSVSSKAPFSVGLNYLIAAGCFLYLFWVIFAEELRLRRANEQRLRESERRFERVIRNSNIMAANQDCELRYTWLYNPHTYLSSIDIVGKTDAALFEVDDAARLNALKRSVLTTGTGTQEEFHARISGQDHYFDLSIEPLTDERGQIVGVNTASRDITERVLLRDRLIQSERLAAAGQLATYLAHEVNSPLQGISSLLDYVQKKHSESNDLQESLGLIHQAFSSIRSTVSNLLDLNRPTRDRLEVVDLNETIRSTFALTSSMLKQSRITVKLELSGDILSVVAFSQRLTQVFI